MRFTLTKNHVHISGTGPEVLLSYADLNAHFIVNIVINKIVTSACNYVLRRERFCTEHRLDAEIDAVVTYLSSSKNATHT